jgi:hypothetical protein
MQDVQVVADVLHAAQGDVQAAGKATSRVKGRRQATAIAAAAQQYKSKSNTSKSNSINSSG